jgi:hypothetical protein
VCGRDETDYGTKYKTKDPELNFTIVGSKKS